MMTVQRDLIDQILEGDATTIFQDFPDQSVDCMVTSPSYFNQLTFSEHSKMRGGRNHFGKRGSTIESGKNQGNSNLHEGRWDQTFHSKDRHKRTVWSVPLSKSREAHFAVFPVCGPSLLWCRLFLKPPTNLPSITFNH